MKIPPVHPFPARMAPEIAIRALQKLQARSTVLDPMVGSGTVLRHAVELGHRAVGCDVDPLAVLMSRVWSTHVSEGAIASMHRAITDVLPKLDSERVELPWIDSDVETSSFVSYWFGRKQIADLRRVAFALHVFSLEADSAQRAAVDVLRVALSRIIIVKSAGASLAADISHSRPHKVASTSDFDVLRAFSRSIEQVQSRVSAVPEHARAKVLLRDVRTAGIARGSVDLVLTSPPYLNAIDYMRGHKLALVWLGHSIPELRTIRSNSVGAERRADKAATEVIVSVRRKMVGDTLLSARHLAIVDRYASDAVRLMEQVSRVLKPSAKAILVVGNSCLKGTFIKNSAGIRRAAELASLEFVREDVRELPEGSRYLPIPKKADSALGKRMRTESVLHFRKIA